MRERSEGEVKPPEQGLVLSDRALCGGSRKVGKLMERLPVAFAFSVLGMLVRCQQLLSLPNPTRLLSPLLRLTSWADPPVCDSSKASLNSCFQPSPLPPR